MAINIQFAIKVFADDVGVGLKVESGDQNRPRGWYATIKTAQEAEEVTGACLGIGKCQVLLEGGGLTAADREYAAKSGESADFPNAEEGVYFYTSGSGPI